jgi:hypothetical protein
MAGKLTVFVPHHDIESFRLALIIETYGADSPEESVTTPFVVPAGGVNQTVPVALFVIYAKPVYEPTQLTEPEEPLTAPDAPGPRSSAAMGGFFAAAARSDFAVVEQPTRVNSVDRVAIPMMIHVVFLINSVLLPASFLPPYDDYQSLNRHAVFISAKAPDLPANENRNHRRLISWDI